MKNIIIERIRDSIAVKKTLLEDIKLLDTIENVAREIINAFRNGNKLILCGNGGSASDALHFAGEIVGKFQKEREARPAVVLNSDVAAMTAIANDYGYNEVFARQTQGYCTKGDIFIGISTSGNSENILRAVEVAKSKGAVTVGLLGRDGGKMASKVDYPVIVSDMITARIQEAHILILHILCEIVEDNVS